MSSPNINLSQGHLLTLLICFVCTCVFSQEKLPADIVPYKNVRTPDSKVGNDSVPDVHYSEITFKKTIVVRLKYKADILDGLKEIVEKEKIKNAVILNGIGSVIQYHVHSVSNSTFPSENKFFKKTEPNDLVSLNGYVIEGRVHAHVLLSNGLTSVGGHLEPGTLVFTFCVITIGIIDDKYSLARFDDKTWR